MRGNIGQMMKQAQMMQENMRRMQEQLGSLEIEGQSGSGAVKVVLTGKHEARRVTIDPSVLSDREMLEDLLVAAWNDAAQKVEAALKAANLGNVKTVGTEVVGPAVGKELTSKGFWATVLSLAGILLYISFRYQLSFAVGAVVATIHDLLVTMAFLAFFQYDITLNVIAAILTVTGYSTNDTIVIFDRVRENLKGMRRDGLNSVINASINQTLGRTIITAGTALLSAIALFLFGGEVLRGFAFTMIVGVITGTYSSVFVAARSMSPAGVIGVTIAVRTVPGPLLFAL